MAKNRRPKLKPIEQIHRIVIYIRVSTKGQAESELGLGAQLHATMSYAATHGYEVVTTYREEGRSARSSQRPEFQRMMSDVLGRDDIDAVLVPHSSRFMRDLEESIACRRRLEQKGVRVLSVMQPAVADEHQGSFVERMFSLVDEQDSRMTSARTSAAMFECARQGYFAGPASRAPYGFAVDRIEVRPRVFRSRLVPDPTERAHQNTLFQTYVEVRGASRTAAKLNLLGIRMRGGRPWNKDAVLRVLDETAAVGSYWYGKHTVDEEDRVEIKVEPTVDRVLWDQAQEVRQQMDPKAHPGRIGSSPMLLAGLLRCERCGSTGTLETAKSGEYRYYGCHTTQNAGTAACPGFRIPEKDLDARVLEHVGRELFTRDRCLLLLKDAVDNSGALHERIREERRSLQGQLDDVSKRLVRWYEQMEIGEHDLTTILPRVSALEAQKKELTQALGSLVAVQKPASHLYNDYAIARFRKSMCDAFLSGDGIARTYLRALFERVVTDGRNVRLVVRGDRAIDLMTKANGAATSSTGSEFSVQPATGSCTPTILRTKKAPVNAGAFLFESALVLDQPSVRNRQDQGAKPRRSSMKLLELLDRAESWHRELNRGAVNQTGLAHRAGVTRARVTQVLGLLRLHPEILAHIRAAAQTTKLSERMLRPLMRLPMESQLREARRLIPSLTLVRQ